MDYEQESGWMLHPLKSETGKAYMGIKDSEKVFLKLNTSPFLAALSIEGVTPRLVWTKRTGNGDVLTAQEWCSGRNLTRQEMGSQKVIDLLTKIHQSKLLKRMLFRLGGKELKASDILKTYEANLAEDLQNHPTLNKAKKYLLDQLGEDLDHPDFTVCHGDLSRKNWLISEEKDLYLVDWDSVVLADAGYDIGQLLSRYSDSQNWQEWVQRYNPKADQTFLRKVKWFIIMNTLLDIKSAHKSGRLNRMNESILKLNQWL